MYPLLLDTVVIRNLESPILYDYLRDEIFELDEEAFEALRLFDGSHGLEEISKITGSSVKDLKVLIDYLIGENLIIDKKVEKRIEIGSFDKSPVPSLRAILVHITNNCNLNCVHCYVDKGQRLEMEPSVFYDIVKQFDQIQGLKVLISGGEPLVHSKFFEMMRQIQGVKIRKVLLTNGVLLDGGKIQKLRGLVQEVQVSLDGTKSHEEFRRMKNIFDKIVENIRLLKESGFVVSVSTMIHKKNVEELPALEKILTDLKVDNWYLDVPTVTGDYRRNSLFHLEPQIAGNILRRYGWGEKFYYESQTYACGAHLCTVMANGDVAKCGFFYGQPVGNIKSKSLRECWEIIKGKYIWEQKDLKCFNEGCEHLKDCKGGCRYRAYIDTGDIKGVDRVKCSYYGVTI